VTLRLFDHLVAASAARYLWTSKQEAGHILGIDAGFDQRWVVDVEVDRPGVGMRGRKAFWKLECWLIPHPAMTEARRPR